MKPHLAATALSAKQVQRLAILGGMAFAISRGRGGVPEGMKVRDWRQQEQGAACGLSVGLSLSDATQGQFNEIAGRFFVILGDAEAAFAAFMQAGPENEARKQLVRRLAGDVAALAAFWAVQKGVHESEASRQAWAYCNAIARDKASGRQVSELDARELTQLGWTIRGRTSAFKGVGNPANRNKSQKRKRGESAAASESDQGAPPEQRGLDLGGAPSRRGGGAVHPDDCPF
jgi:hypothetical protein